MALPPDDKKKTADKPTQVTPAASTTPPPLNKSPAYSDARKAAIAQAAERQTKPGIAKTTAAASDTQTV